MDGELLRMPNSRYVSSVRCGWEVTKYFVERPCYSGQSESDEERNELRTRAEKEDCIDLDAHLLLNDVLQDIPINEKWPIPIRPPFTKDIFIHNFVISISLAFGIHRITQR